MSSNPTKKGGNINGSLLGKSYEHDPRKVNELAEKILQEIINHPEKKLIRGTLQRFGGIVDIYAPNGRGARYNEAGEFIGFLEP